MSRKAKQRVAFKRNMQSLNYWAVRALMMEASCVEWKGLPKYLDTEYLELTLARSGSALIGYDDLIDKYFVCQNASVGRLDADGIPEDRRGILRNGTQLNFTPDTSVIIFNNSMRTGDIWIINMVARRMANIDGAIDVNINSQKTMPMIPTSQEQALTIENVYNDLENNIPYVLLDNNSLDVEQLRNYLLFDNSKSFTSDKMMSVQRDIWNRFLAYCGINNLNTDKRERLVSSEASVNLEEILMMKRNRLNTRNKAVNDMERVFGWTGVEVNYYGGGGEIGNIYDVSSDNVRRDLHEESQYSGPEAD